MVLFSNDDGVMDGGQQHEQKTIANRPQTVSSLSSIETAIHDHNDVFGIESSIARQSSITSLPPLPSLMEGTGSGSTVVSSITTVPPTTSTDSNYVLSTTSNNTTLYVGGSATAVAQNQQVAASSAINLTGSGAVQISQSTGVLVAATPNTNTVPEFLYQLTKMLTDNNRDIIEWSNGKIEVHSPHKLETHVLNRYFRHSKFASFQRQLNYFGFRKLAGKGKMAPCSYVNDATTDELGSLLLIKRKQGNEVKTKSGGKKRARGVKEEKSASAVSNKVSGDTVNPVLAGILYRSASGSDNALAATGSSTTSTMQQSQKALARVAVGKGVRHGYVPQQPKNLLKTTDSPNALYTQKVSGTTTLSSSPVEASLNALTQNFNQSMHDAIPTTNELGVKPSTIQTQEDAGLYTLPAPAPVSTSAGRATYVPGSLHRDDSLVDLAMIPIIGDGNVTDSNVATTSGFSFVDFPFDSNIFANEDPTP